MRPAIIAAGLLLSVPAFAEDPAARLAASPRHGEWVAIAAGARSVQTFVVHPERKDKALAVIVIHENRGLTDWVRAVADRLAENGYVALAPDLLSGTGPLGGRTKDFPSSDAAREAIHALPADQVMADLRAIADHAAKLPSSNGKVAVAGFCWGGSTTFRFATVRPDLAGAFVFYGSAPAEPEALARIQAPVFGFYGSEDARINATLPATIAAMKGRRFEPITYEGAGHAFLRAAEEKDASEATKKAGSEAWTRWLDLLKTL